MMVVLLLTDTLHPCISCNYGAATFRERKTILKSTAPAAVACFAGNAVIAINAVALHQARVVGLLDGCLYGRVISISIQPTHLILAILPSVDAWALLLSQCKMVFS